MPTNSSTRLASSTDWLTALKPSHMRRGSVAVSQSVLDARLQIARNRAHQAFPEVASDDVAAERQRELRLLIPPLAHVGPEMQTAVGVGQLALMDQESRIGVSGSDAIFDLIEGNDDVTRGRLVQSQRQKRRHP